VFCSVKQKRALLVFYSGSADKVKAATDLSQAKTGWKAAFDAPEWRTGASVSLPPGSILLKEEWL